MYGNCCGPGYVGRRYYSREERAIVLKEYKDALENELKGVKERIQELEASSDA